MKKYLILFVVALCAMQITGCSVISAVATSNRMEEARTANAGKQLVPKDDGTYLIAVGLETSSYLGSGDTDFKINNAEFTQPKGTYSIIPVNPAAYVVYANKRVVGGGEASATLDAKKGESLCFYVVNPLSAAARIEATKNDACDPFLRSIRNQNIVQKVN